MSNYQIIKKMKILTLIIKQKFFDEIVNGRKTIEYRDVTRTSAKKLVLTDENGRLIENQESDVSPYYPKEYDAIRFYVGYQKERDTALFKVKKIVNKAILTDDGKFIYDGDPQSADFFVFSVNEYYLGEAIEVKHKNK